MQEPIKPNYYPLVAMIVVFIITVLIWTGAYHLFFG